MKVSKEVKVGLLTVVAGVILYLGFNFLKGIDFLSSSKTYYAVYDDVAGLDVSNAVILNGFVVGRVNSINFVNDKDNRLFVEFQVRKDIALGDSTVALIGGEILENKSIQLHIGRISRVLADKDTVRSEVQKGITEILQEKALPLVDNFNDITVKINDILDSFEGNSTKINSSLSKLESTSENMRLMTSVGGKLDGTIANFKQLSEGLVDEEKGISPLLSKTNILMDSLNTLELSRTLAKLEGAISSMKKISESINSGQGTMGKLIKNDSLYNQLNGSIKSLDLLLQHIDENPKHFFGPLGKSKKKIERDLRKQEEADLAK